MDIARTQQEANEKSAGFEEERRRLEAEGQLHETVWTNIKTYSMREKEFYRGKMSAATVVTRAVTDLIHDKDLAFRLSERIWSGIIGLKFERDCGEKDGD